MTLAALIKKGGLTGTMTATPATLATEDVDSTVSVADVATVAVASDPEPTDELSPEEDSKIQAWLAHIEETDPDLKAEVIQKCRNDQKARANFLKLSEETLSDAFEHNSVTCGECAHFEQINHPNLGHCSKGEPEAIAGIWDTDRRHCELFLSKRKVNFIY